MQYDPILLEFFSRIKELETALNEINGKLQRFEQESQEYTEPKPCTDVCEDRPDEGAKYQRLTGKMIHYCYEAGKKAFMNQHPNYHQMAEKIAKDTGMNPSTAFMYTYVVKCLLNGEPYKRAISVKATEAYLNQIAEEFGAQTLQNALNAIREHVAYRQKLGQTAKSLSDLCDFFQKRLDSLETAAP